LECGYYRCAPLKFSRSVYKLAKSKKIDVIRIETIKSASFVRTLEIISPDLLFVGGGWHELIPKKVLRIPKLGALNVHPSLLPNYRCTSITRWQILHGDKQSRSSVLNIDDRFDT